MLSPALAVGAHSVLDLWLKIFLTVSTSKLAGQCAVYRIRVTLNQQILKAGAGPTPKKGANITVHCTGLLESGKKFWRYLLD